MSIAVGPHKFTPLHFWDRFRKKGKCRDCFLAKYAHPVNYWVHARPLWDRSGPNLEVSNKYAEREEKEGRNVNE